MYCIIVLYDLLLTNKVYMPAFSTYINTKKLVRIFAEIDFHDYSYQMIQSIRSEILTLSKDYIINVNEDELITALESKYHLETISFDYENKAFENPEKEDYNEGGRTYIFYNFVIKIPYNGSNIVLRLQPSQRAVISYPIYIDHDREFSNKIIYIHLRILGKNKSEFDQELSNAVNAINANLDNINNEVESWNNNLKEYIKTHFYNIKKEYLSENEFFESLNIKVDDKSDVLFNPEVIKKKVIELPRLGNKAKKFTTSPTLNEDVYKDIITNINSVGKSMERKPSIYQGKDEESLRDFILMFLENRYESTTATGETFNKMGKTDILLKYTDGNNLFVAECKFWHGEKKFNEAIEQLFGYLTWRDSKAALVVFVNNKDFSSVIETIKKTTSENPLYKSITGIKEETSFSCVFRFPDDSKKEIMLEIMLFHFN